jgi:hypothetical protein
MAIALHWLSKKAIRKQERQKGQKQQNGFAVFALFAFLASIGPLRQFIDSDGAVRAQFGALYFLPSFEIR